MSTVAEFFALLARYSATVDTTEADPISDCGLCPEHPANPGAIAIYWDGGILEVCETHTEAALQQALQECEDARERHPQLRVEVSVPAAELARVA